MSIVRRIRRIAEANIQWLLNKAEPAEAELEAKIGELSEAVRESKAAAGTYGAMFRRLETETRSLAGTHDELQSRAEAAVAAGDDDLARGLLAEKVRAGERINSLTPGLEQGRQTYEHLRTNLTCLSDQLRQARIKLAELRSRKRSAEARKVFGEQLDAAAQIGPDGPMFDRMAEQVDQAEAEADVLEDLQGDDVDLRQRSLQLQVEGELDALKDKLCKDQE